MDLRNIPTHAWWIITPFLIVPVGFLIVSMGLLLNTYATILPNAKNVTVKTGDIEIATEFAARQIAINEHLQKIVATARESVEKTIALYGNQSVASAPAATNSMQTPEAITKLKQQAVFLQHQLEQLDLLKNELINFKSTIQPYQQNKLGALDGK